MRFGAGFGGYSQHAGNKPRPSAGPGPRSALAKVPKQPLLLLSPVRQRVETRARHQEDSVSSRLSGVACVRGTPRVLGNTARPGRPSKGNQHGRRAWPHHRHSSQHRSAPLRAPAQHRDQGRVQDDRVRRPRDRVAGILLASFLVKTGQDGQRPDYLRADKAWWYITLLTIGYLVARELAKSRSREPYDDRAQH